MKYLKRFELFERLSLSDDLVDMIRHLADEKNKVAEFLVRVINNGDDVYKNEEDLNNIDFSEELNKFSFVPRKKRKDDEDFDTKSMPTRIGKVVRNIFTKVKPYLNIDKEIQGAFTASEDSDEKNMYEFKHNDKDLSKFIYSSMDWFPRTKAEVTFEGKKFQFTLHDSWNLYQWNEKTDSYEQVPCMYLHTDEDVSDLVEKKEVTLHVKAESNLILLDKDIEEFVNSVVAYLKLNKAESDSDIIEVTGEDIRFWYHNVNYQSKTGDLGSSCMSYDETQEYLDIYCENTDKISLLILKSKEDKLLGRALLWKLDNDKIFMDRVYSILHSDANLFYKKAKDNGWIYKKGKEKIIYQEQEFDGDLYVTLDYTDFSNYPYLDTLCFLDPSDGVLSNREPYDEYYLLQSTEGGYSERWVND
jgi:hypothetical protein